MRILAERSSIAKEIYSWPAGLLRNVDQYSEIKWLIDLSLESLCVNLQIKAALVPSVIWAMDSVSH